jgi:NADH-quinone oxidoreductase subunit L
MTDAAHATALSVTAVSYLRWIPFLPLVTAAVNGVFGASIQRRFGERGVSILACASVVGSFLLSVKAFFDLVGLDPHHRLLLDSVARWIDVPPLHVDIALTVDPLTAVMILVITGIGGLIHFYSVGYMHGDRGLWRYFAYLNLFTFAMLTLVMGDNLLLMFVGWEGVGLCSWALIGFWYQDVEKAQAGNKAFIVNRIGDFGFILGVFLLFWSLEQSGHATLVFREIQANAGRLEGMTFWGMPVVVLVTLLLFVGATGKSAQIPLYVWLPDAMAGPTPVSALIHAATMVTAGVYMIGRVHFLYSMAEPTLHVVAVIGALTALGAATIGLTQNDIKKVLAYSTVSQLGYMFLAMGVGAYVWGIFHLFTHAFFKACLFLGSGSVIHGMGGEQDMRKMGGLSRYMPRTYWTFLIATLAIAGAPLTAGFFSKDGILAEAYHRGGVGLWLAGAAGAGMTAFYMFRQVFMVFFGTCRADEHTKHHLHESPPIMTIPLMVLAGGSLVVGWLGLPPFMGHNAFAGWLEPVFGHPHHGLSVAAEIGLMVTSVAIATAGASLAYAMYVTRRIRPETFSDLAGGLPYRAMYNKYWVDEIYDVIFVRGTLLLARIGALFDKYVIDGIVDGSAKLTTLWSWVTGGFDFRVIDGAVNTVSDSVLEWGSRVRKVQTGSINAYLYAIVVGVVGVMIARMIWFGGT